MIKILYLSSLTHKQPYHTSMGHIKNVQNSVCLTTIHINNILTKLIPNRSIYVYITTYKI